MLPNLRVVLLQGGDAKDTWRRLVKRHPEIRENQQFKVVGTYHPGRQALWSSDPAVREARIHHRVDAYRRVAEALH